MALVLFKWLFEGSTAINRLQMSAISLKKRIDSQYPRTDKKIQFFQHLRTILSPKIPQLLLQAQSTYSKWRSTIHGTLKNRNAQCTSLQRVLRNCLDSAAVSLTAPSKMELFIPRRAERLLSSSRRKRDFRELSRMNMYRGSRSAPMRRASVIEINENMK